VGSNPTSSAIHLATYSSAVAIHSSDGQPLSRFRVVRVILETEGSIHMDKAPRGRGIIVGMMIFAAVLILAYWVIWFLVDRDLFGVAVSRRERGLRPMPIAASERETPMSPVRLDILFPIDLDPRPQVGEQ
jgi:hypothetical protein